MLHHATPMDEFPFVTSYPSAALEIPLAVTPRRPVAALALDACHVTGCLAAAEGGLATSGGRARVLLDFGSEVVGWLSLVAEAAGAAHLRLTYGEHADEARRGEPSRVHFYTLQEDRFECPGGRCSFRSHGRRAFRYVQLTIESAHPVALTAISVAHQHAAVARHGSFTCSDERLNRIWELCRDTTLLCMQNYYEDGIKRDGLLWIGDYRVQYLCNLGCFGDQRLARKSLAMIAASQRADGAIPACAGIGGGKQHPEVIDCMPGIPAWPERWILLNYMSDFISSVREFALYSGEDVAEFLPAVRRALAFLLTQRDVPAETLQHHFISDDGLTPPDGVKPYRPLAALLAHLHWGLADGAALLEPADAALAARCRARCAELRQELAARCATPSGLLRDADDKDYIGWHANAMAVLAGMIEHPRTHLQTLLNCRDALRPEIGFLRFWMLEALFVHGFHAEALELIRRAWGAILDAGLGTSPESVRENAASYFTPRSPLSLCHGWSAGPAWLLPRHILGVRVLEPGWRAVTVRPHLCGLRHACAVIPTPRGDLSIECDGTRVHCDAPRGMILQTAFDR